jgi:hypothetical protein
MRGRRGKQKPFLTNLTVCFVRAERRHLWTMPGHPVPIPDRADSLSPSQISPQLQDATLRRVRNAGIRAARYRPGTIDESLAGLSASAPGA